MPTHFVTNPGAENYEQLKPETSWSPGQGRLVLGENPGPEEPQPSTGVGSFYPESNKNYERNTLWCLSHGCCGVQGLERVMGSDVKEDAEAGAFWRIY